MSVASSGRCKGAMISLECTTWSAAHFLPDMHGKQGVQYRSANHILGIPQENGTLPSAVTNANKVAAAGAAIALAAGQSGARVIAETPAPRGTGVNGVTKAWPSDALTGAEAHVYLFDHPSWRDVITKLEAAVFVSDLCTFADAHDPLARGEKATAFLASANAKETAALHFDGYRCTHKKGTHPALRGANGRGGYKTAGSERYSSNLCRALAAVLLDTEI